MKKLVFTVIALFTFSLGASLAQTVDEEIKLVQDAFGKDKKSLVEAYMSLSPDKAATFWPVYEAFEA